MNKNSNKLKNFLDEHFVDYFGKNDYENEFIRSLKMTFKNLPSPEYTSHEQIFIEKINHGETPLIYELLKKKNYPNKKIISSFRSFLNWYKKNGTKMILSDIINDDIIFNPISHRKELHDMLYKNPFLFIDTMLYAESKNLNLKQFNDDLTQIYLYEEENNKNTLNIGQIFKIINFFRKITNKNINVKLVVLLFDQKRYFTTKKLITPENINAGCTIPGIYIYIWRSEEIMKVLIHELVHFFLMDFCTRENIEIKNHMNSILNINGIDIVNEAYTEITTVILNSVIYSEINKIPFNTIIGYEILFTHLQISKLINFFGGSKFDDLFKITINQTTSLASYFIIKGMLLYNLNHILNYVEETNFLQSDIDYHYNKYISLYKKIITKNNKSLNDKLINNMIKIIRQQNTSYITKSIKMILFEI